MDHGDRPPRPAGAEATPAAAPPAPAGGDGLSHLAFLYRDADEYLEHVLAFIADGLAWTSGHEVVCQVHDGGWITDPMAGRKRPPPDAPGQGLWVVNHICDLVETRSGPAGTTTRLHFRLPGG